MALRTAGDTEYVGIKGLVLYVYENELKLLTPL